MKNNCKDEEHVSRSVRKEMENTARIHAWRELIEDWDMVKEAYYRDDEDGEGRETTTVSNVSLAN